MTGAELKQRRVAADLRSWQVGAAMGVSTGRISQIEALASVTPQACERYLVALDKCLVAKTGAVA